MKPRLAIFFTGGTISMRIDPATGGAIPALSGEEIIAQVPGLGDIAGYDLINFDRLPGPHWTPQRMMELAVTVREKLQDKTIVGAVAVSPRGSVCLDVFRKARVSGWTPRIHFLHIDDNARSGHRGENL